MTDKEKIKAEVNRIFIENRQRSSLEGYAAVEQLRRVLAYIDRMSEEPVSEVLEEAVNGVAWEDFDSDGNKFLVINATGTKLRKGDKFKMIIIKEE